MRLTRRRAIVLGLLAIVAVALLAPMRSNRFRGWLRAVTGEESYVEGLKGAVALALLDLTGPHPALAPDAPLDYRTSQPYGANVFLQLEADPDNVRRSFAMLRDAGITWARQQFPWEDIEIHGRGDFQDRRNDPARSAWDKYDRIVAMSRDYGVNLLVRLDDPPNWAYADPKKSGDKGPPDNLDDYANFVATVARRYCGQVKYYQLWNEPNIYPEWGERAVDPAGYAALLKAGAAAAREACPDVVVVSAALAQNTEPGGKNMDDLKYLEGLYKAGWQPDFDVLAAQAFGLFTGPTDHRVSADRANFGRMLLARDIMVKQGDAAKPVWVTEMGWTSPPADFKTLYGRVSEDKRADYTVGAYERIQNEWPWIGPAFLWFFRRPDESWNQAQEGYGYFRIVEPDWTETPTYAAIKEAATAPPLLYRGRHGITDPAFQYSGPWRQTSGVDGRPLRIGATDAEVQLTFRGTGFQARLAPAADGAVPPKLFMVVDGESKEVLPTVAGDQITLGASGLSADDHVAIIRVDDGELRLQEVDVFAPDPPAPMRPFWLTLIGLIVLVILAGAGWLYLLRRLGRPSAAPAGPPPPNGPTPAPDPAAAAPS